MLKLRVKRHAVTQPLDKPFRFIPLTQGKTAIVDASDFDWLNKWNWCAAKRRGTFYAVRTDASGETVCMHALICGFKNPDHRNRNGLDNRRSNLRPSTTSQNGQNVDKRHHNTSGFRGVHWSKKEQRWHARIASNGRRMYLGWFHTAEQAAHAYDKAAKIHHGEFATLNFPE